MESKAGFCFVAQISVQEVQELMSIAGDMEKVESWVFLSSPTKMFFCRQDTGITTTLPENRHDIASPQKNGGCDITFPFGGIWPYFQGRAVSFGEGQC